MMNGREKSRSAIAARKKKKEKFTPLLHSRFARRERKLADLHSPVHRGAIGRSRARGSIFPSRSGSVRRRAARWKTKSIEGRLRRVLNAIYEEDFLGFSYGFRSGRGQHDAMDALVVGIRSKKVSWILDANIETFFDTVNQQRLMAFVEHRVGDKRIPA
jgi:RNA-directed DNA polymerase